jgi:hypothetical protein
MALIHKKDNFVKGGRRKGEELWLEMWGKEMEKREEERKIEKVKSQVSSVFLAFLKINIFP